MFWHVKCQILSFKMDNSASFTSSRMKVKIEGKLIFRDAYRLSENGIVGCLEIIDVGCNLKQIDGLTWLTLTVTPIFYDRSTQRLNCKNRSGKRSTPCSSISFSLLPSLPFPFISSFPSLPFSFFSLSHPFPFSSPTFLSPFSPPYPAAKRPLKTS